MQHLRVDKMLVWNLFNRIFSVIRHKLKKLLRQQFFKFVFQSFTFGSLNIPVVVLI